MYATIKRKKAVFYLISFLAAVCFIAVVLLLSGKSDKKASTDTNGMCVSFLQDKKISLSDCKPICVETVLLKKESSDVMNEYNALQKKQGFDLSGYFGKTVLKYTFSVDDRKRTDVVAVLFVYDEKIIGGDIHCIGVDGYMTGFDGETI